MSTTDRHSLMRLLNSHLQRVANMIRRGRLTKVKDEAPVQTVQVKLFKGEVRDQTERLQDYGQSSVPFPGCDVLAVCAGGECGHETVIKADDRRYRPRNLAPGDVMTYTRANKCCGNGEPNENDPDTEHHIHLVCDGRVIRMRAKNLIIDVDEEIIMNAVKRIVMNAPEIIANTSIFDCSGDVKDSVRTMQGDRDLYNEHGHPDASPPPSPSQ